MSGLRAGVMAFNERRFFDAHEAWEEHWGSGGRAETELTLGLIKAAVALHHLEARNVAGFLWQAQEAIPRLRAHATLHPEMGIAAFAEELESLVAQTRFRGAPPETWDPPQLGLPDASA